MVRDCFAIATLPWLIRCRSPAYFRLPFACGSNPLFVCLNPTMCDKNKMPKRAFNFYGGWCGIRTPGRVAPSTVFKTAAFDRSANHPKLSYTRRSFKPTVLVLRMIVSYSHLASQSRPPHSTALPTIRNRYIRVGFWYSKRYLCMFVRYFIVFF